MRALRADRNEALAPRGWPRAPRRALKISLTMAVIAAIAGGAWWWAVLRPQRRLQRMLAAPAARAASPAELRDAAHAVLRFPGPDPHDAFVVLLSDGDASSVPVLIGSLRWQPHTPSNGSMPCTKAHCLDALRKLTARDLGNNYGDWAPLLRELSAPPAPTLRRIGAQLRRAEGARPSVSEEPPSQ